MRSCMTLMEPRSTCLPRYPLDSGDRWVGVAVGLDFGDDIGVAARPKAGDRIDSGIQPVAI